MWLFVTKCDRHKNKNGDWRSIGACDMNNLDAVIQDAVGTCLARLGDNNMSWREE